MRKLLLRQAAAACITALTLVSCNDNSKKQNGGEETAGGPCSYRNEILPVVVLNLKQMDDGQYNLVLLRNPGGTVPDTFYYSDHQQPQYIPDSLIRAKNIRQGDTLRMVESFIISGACNPHLVAVELERYRKP